MIAKYATTKNFQLTSSPLSTQQSPHNTQEQWSQQKRTKPTFLNVDLR